ncbi:MAG: hypothetical protein J0M00_07045 [Burkholderiales bacterium]|nr:hypothetical protein [Burkholderiales bacterium]
MNDSELHVTIDLPDEIALTAPEAKLLADLLPELVKDLIWLNEQNED